MQSINLYQAHFKSEVVKLSVKHMLLVVGAVSILMLLTSLFQAWSNYSLNKNKKDMAASFQNLKQENDNMQKRLDSQSVNSDLHASVVQAERQYNARQRITAWVDKSKKNQQVLFSELLEGLGRQKVKGMWLSHIAINESGQNLHFEGAALHPKLLPEFIGKLDNESVYSGRNFRKVFMQRDLENIGIIEFLLTTHEDFDRHVVTVNEQIKNIN